MHHKTEPDHTPTQDEQSRATPTANEPESSTRDLDLPLVGPNRLPLVYLRVA